MERVADSIKLPCPDLCGQWSLVGRVPMVNGMLRLGRVEPVSQSVRRGKRGTCPVRIIQFNCGGQSDGAIQGCLHHQLLGW